VIVILLLTAAHPRKPDPCHRRVKATLARSSGSLRSGWRIRALVQSYDRSDQEIPADKTDRSNADRPAGLPDR
jgi:hypothetical protein